MQHANVHLGDSLPATNRDRKDTARSKTGDVLREWHNDEGEGRWRGREWCIALLRYGRRPGRTARLQLPIRADRRDALRNGEPTVLSTMLDNYRNSVPARRSRLGDLDTFLVAIEFPRCLWSSCTHKEWCSLRCAASLVPMLTIVAISISCWCRFGDCGSFADSSIRHEQISVCFQLPFGKFQWIAV